MKDSTLQQFGFEFRTDGISNKVKSISISAIKGMVAIAEKLENPVSFSWGIPPFATANFIRQYIIELLNDQESYQIDAYSSVAGQIALKTAFTNIISKQKKVDLDPTNEVLVTCGAMEAIRLSLEALIDPGDEVILFSPSFPSHREQIILAQGKPVYVPLIEEAKWQIDFDLLTKSISSKTKAIIITSPNNPTGNILSKDDLQKIQQLAEEHNLFVISDETYDFLTYGNISHISALTLPRFKERFIVCFTCSKKYAMSGWRVGFLCADAGIIQHLHKVHDATVVCVPTISQLAATRAITGPQDSVKQQVAIYADRLHDMCKRLDKLSHIFSYQKPDGAYYMFPKINPKIATNDVDFCIEVLKKAKVVLVPGSAFGPSGAGHVRIVFSLEEAILHEGFDRLDKYFGV